VQCLLASAILTTAIAEAARAARENERATAAVPL